MSMLEAPSHMSAWNDYKGAPVWRALLLAIGLLVAGCADSGLLEPEMKVHQNCFEPVTYSVLSLQRLMDVDDLYYDDMQSVDATTPDYWMLKKYDLAGYISGFGLDSESQTIPAGQSIRFTGNVYERVPSVPQRIFGAAENRLLYEVKIDVTRFVMPVFLFLDPPLPPCIGNL